MKNKSTLWIIMLSAIITTLASCRRDTILPNDYSYMNFQTTCLGSSMDGTVRLQAWGTGATRAEAIENAKRNAVRDIKNEFDPTAKTLLYARSVSNLVWRANRMKAKDVGEPMFDIADCEAVKIDVMRHSPLFRSHMVLQGKGQCPAKLRRSCHGQPCRTATAPNSRRSY